MKKFLRKTLLFLVPVFMLLAVAVLLYIRKDPYNDFKTDTNYPWKYSFQQMGDLSTKKLLVSPHHYDSFIFGSSRTCGVYACYLERKIPGSHFFHYANWNETIGGILAKLRLLDSLHYPIENVVIYLDEDRAFSGQGDSRSTDHYLLTGQSRPGYLFGHFKTFFSSMNSDKLNILLGRPVDGTLYVNKRSDSITNDFDHYCSDAVIASYGNPMNGPAFRKEIEKKAAEGFFYSRPATQQYDQPQISKNEAGELKAISRLLQKHHTRFYVVLPPLYDQKKLAAADMRILHSCFGVNLYDFTGINAITNSIYNYPDRHHFQPYISKTILDSIVH